MIFFFLFLVSTGLPAEGLLHCHAGPAAAHGGGLLEDGVGVEVSLHRHADRAAGEGAGMPSSSVPVQIDDKHIACA